MKILRCWPAMQKIGMFLRSSDAKACDSDSCCGLAWDASARDAKSLARWVERCEPLSSSPNCSLKREGLRQPCLGLFASFRSQRPQHCNVGWLRTGRSCFGNSALLKAIIEAPKLEPPKTPIQYFGNAEGSRNPWVMKFHGRLGCWFISL